MKAAIFNAIIDTLKADTTLVGYLGGPYVFRAQKIAPARIPSVTVRMVGETSHMRTGFTQVKTAPIPHTILRFKQSTITVKVWVSSQHTGFPQTGADSDLIADHIEDILLDSTNFPTGPAGDTESTHAWNKVSETQMHEDEKELWCNTMRFTFEYHEDTAP